MKRGQTKGKRDNIRKTSQNDSKKGKEQSTKKTKFYELIARQKQIKNIKLEKKKAIEKKREERLHNRKERNISMQKLTRKGQPVMKHRIKLLLKQLCPGDA
ncbi:unnamed protein product [Schistosoma rodhaini]|uniref:Coiled-coil domain-containing protein 86 n=1 Tax=Schistosoma rodhaini TaxID=6188 RepID=A0AA85FV98_9TREM|nr:unnamed protein product [Schistosoma rodhaini]